MCYLCFCNAMIMLFSNIYAITKEKRLAEWLISSLCDLGGAQTRDLRNRNPAFYSTELRGRDIACTMALRLSFAVNRSDDCVVCRVR